MIVCWLSDVVGNRFPGLLGFSGNDWRRKVCIDLCRFLSIYKIIVIHMFSEFHFGMIE